MAIGTGRGSFRANKKRADRAVAAWNRDHQPGLKVKLRTDDDKVVETVTRSVAWEASGQAIILVEGRTGGYLLSRVTPA